ncbi:TfuA domain-containing protein [Mesorhizobium caraganae]|uniref:TfuA domain-containing protein n=1 Tax=Mesorhizobium caraganae TaxID=483206 RepID=UPI00177C25AA|nr:TfuA domain-containing protein [Mesorhizobium caraganae]
MLIDGFFRNVPSVGHKEVLWGLSEGVTIIGASSIGALRAAEMDAFGMIGIGEIYRQFAGGILTRDDEVALLHAPAQMGYKPLTEALVNIRASAARAVQNGRASPTFVQRLVDAAASLDFDMRTWEQIYGLLEFPKESASDDVHAFHWIRDDRYNQKKRDALEALAWLNEMSGVGTRSTFTFNDTWFFSQFRRAEDNPLIRNLF